MQGIPMKNEALRDTLIQQAEGAFFALTEQIDVLFDMVGFYMERYPAGSQSEMIKAKELKVTVENIAEATSQLAEVLKRWKHGEERVLSRVGTELTILNELWANVQALIYFLVSHEISMDDFNAVIAAGSFQALVKCNRLIT